MATFDEVHQAAALWAQLVTLWESYESGDDIELEGELLDQIGALVDEWQGFVGEKPEPT